tara:strand:+ start:4095 stop:5129 length:1035 start_codon:yes stop_codon:yes gene_type:complete
MLAEAVASVTQGSIHSEKRFGTASIVNGNTLIDIATLRTETYTSPGALPKVQLGATIEADLGRRDFNVNALALALTGSRSGEFIDLFDGLADLSHHRFRVLRDDTFEQDATRLWRAARLSVHRDLHPTTSTLAKIIDGARWINTISGDRLRAEFTLIAERGRAARTLKLLEEWGVIENTSAALSLSTQALKALRYRWRPLPLERLIAILLAYSEPRARTHALRRLNTSNAINRTVRDTQLLLSSTEADLDCLETLVDTVHEARIAARWLDNEQELLQDRLDDWIRTRPHMEANELIAEGVEEGPTLSSLLSCLRRGRYLGTLSSVTQARALVRRHLDRRRIQHD